MEWLKEEMKARKLTNREVGQVIGLDDGQISRVLKGQRKLSAIEADNIRRFLGYTLPDDESSALDRRLLRILSHMPDDRKVALEMLLQAQIESEHR